MRKFELFIFLFMLLFAQMLYCGQYNELQNLSFQSTWDDEVCFESDDSYLYVVGELPSGQVLFSVTSITQSLFSNGLKIKKSYSESFPFNTKINFNFSIHQDSIFTRYCSSFVQIYLKTACFRL